jgi:hypothetical protein
VMAPTVSRYQRTKIALIPQVGCMGMFGGSEYTV